MQISPERKYVAVSVKHSRHQWKFGMPLIMWGTRTTDDAEPRLFGGYTMMLSSAERYAKGDFEKHYPNAPNGVFRPDPAPMDIGFMKENKEWDTVLVDAEQMRHYYIAAGIETT